MLAAEVGTMRLTLHALCRFWTLAEPYTLEVEIKKSRFITSAWPVKTAAEVNTTCPLALVAASTVAAAHPLVPCISSTCRTRMDPPRNAELLIFLAGRLRAVRVGIEPGCIANHQLTCLARLGPFWK